MPPAMANILLPMLLLLGVSSTPTPAPECRIRLLHLFDSGATSSSVQSAMEAAKTAINADSSLLPGCTLEIHDRSYMLKTQMVGKLIRSLPVGDSDTGWLWDNQVWAQQDSENGRSACSTPACYYITVGVIAATGTQPTVTVNAIIQSKLVIHGSYSARGTLIDSLITDPQATFTAGIKGHGSFFRTCPSDVHVVRAAAVLIQTLGWSKVGASVAWHMQLFT